MTFIERFRRLRSGQVRYMLPVCFIALSTISIFYAEHFLHAPYLVSFMAAVAVSALFGLIPGFIAIVLATLASDFFFIPPLLKLNLDRLTWLANFSPFHYAQLNAILVTHQITWWHPVLLSGAGVIGVIAGLIVFERRDLA